MRDIIGEKIIIFVIGLLFGAVIATGAFMVCTKTCHKQSDNRHDAMQLPRGNQPSMNNGQAQNNQNGQPPEMPNNDNNSQSNSNTQTNNA